MMRGFALIGLPVLVAAAPLVAAETISVSSFRTVELRGGGTMIVRPGPAGVRIVEGSSRFTGFRVDRDGQLKIDMCSRSCPAQYRLTVELHYPTVPPMAVKGGGRISVVPGFGPQAKIAAGVQGGGQIDLRAVRAATVAVGIDGGGQILLGEPRTLAAAVNGGGEVSYSGNPRITAINDGGLVHRAN